jgi:hypothetical protein
MSKINNLQAIKTVVQNGYTQMGVAFTMGSMGMSSAFAATGAAGTPDTTALTGGSRQGQSAAGESVGAIKDRGINAMDAFMSFLQYAGMLGGFIVFVLGVIDLLNINQPGKDATPAKAFTKMGIGAVLAGAGYFYWSAANSAAGNV